MWTALAAMALASAQASASEATFDRFRASVFTIEVHSGRDAARSSLGSGYRIAPGGLIVTNYHVVAPWIAHPDRYRIRARNETGEFDLRLVQFDLVNDLALLAGEGIAAPPLTLAREDPAPGAAVVAFGDPHGLGLSLVQGIFNGPAEKGLVPRMRLSMPLNPGMSGGPILSAGGEVVGTNVSVIWLADALSFGVPASRIRELLRREPLPDLEEATLDAETTRQLEALETETAARLIEGFAARQGTTVEVGGARFPAPPSFFDCWDGSEEHEAQGLSSASYGCDLEFTPSLEESGVVGSVHFQVEHFASRSSSFGFYGWLGERAQSLHGVGAVDPDTDEVRSAPHCVVERVGTEGGVWSVNACVNAYLDHAGLFDLSLVATSVTRSREAVLFSVSLRGFRRDTCLALSRRLLTGVTLGGAG